MTTIELLTRLRKRDIHVWLEDEKLRYRAPEGALTPDLRQQIVARKADIIDFLRQATDAVGSDAMPIERAPRDGDLPLSFAQQRLWFLDQLEPGSPAYNIPQALRFQGAVSFPALERALTEIVGRHEVLRTSMPSLEGRPRQVIHPPASQPLPQVDLTSLPAEAREAEARRLTTAEAAAPFDLARGPVCRTGLLSLSHDDHVLLVTIHHIAADGWSLGILVRELQALYQAFCEPGRPDAASPLPELAIQYADFAAWQRLWLSEGELERQVRFWKRQLEGAPPVLDLPGDRPYPPARSFRGDKVSLRVPKEALDSLADLARQENATLFMVTLALFQVLLGRYSGQHDVVVGSPIANRNRGEVEGLIGFFVNTLVLRLTSTPGLSLRQLVARARETALGAYAHQDVPFEKLVEELDPERDLSRHPLFQVMFALQNAPAEALDLPGVKLRPMGGERLTAKFDWNVSLWESPHGLGGWLEYSSDLFDRTTAWRVVRHFAALAAGAARHPDAPVFELDLLGPGEHQQLLREWNPPVDTGLDPPPAHALLEAQAERTPERLAAVFGQRAMTYMELDRRSNQLAHRLRELGVGPDVAVGISLQRSLHVAVAVAGVLKAGGAYVPLDPAYPRERLDYMLEDSGARVIVTQASIAEALFVTKRAELDVVLSDDGWSELESQPGHSPKVALGRDNLLYMIYTSGSTGRPKGIALSHLALVNLVRWHLRTLLRGRRTLQYASLSFDASFHEMFAAWSSGGTIFLIPDDLRRDVGALARLLSEERLEKVIFPVVLLQRLAELPREALPLSLGEVVSTGEQLHVTPLLAEFVAGLGDCSFHNHYGPSETHVVTAYTLRGAHPGWPSHPPAGRPIDNAPVYVVDRWGNPAPAGVPGELFLGGVALARGYLGRPLLTAEKFVPDPWADGARLYRTGDLARTLPDGNLEFLGRIDHQVKIRGHRVELGEIESVLARHDQVRQCVVLSWKDRAGFESLVAYVVPEEGRAPRSGELRRFLGETLPEFMLPAYFVELEALPLSPNKKVDRKALPAPETAAAQSAEVVEPRTLVEEGLAEIWHQVLALEPGRRVSVHDNFFHLGGHSLNATQVVAHVCRLFDAELPVRRLFEAPTLAALAAEVEDAIRSGRGVKAPPVVPVPRAGREVPLTFSQERLWFIDQLMPGQSIYNLPSVLRLEGALDHAALERTLAEIVRRHEVLRTTFGDTDGRPHQVIHPAEEAARFARLPVADLSALPADAALAEGRRRAGREGKRPFDLRRGPLLRSFLLRLADEDHVAVFVLHHTVSDGWSQGVLVRELKTFYDALSAGEEAPLGDLEVQYADFAVWQRSWLRDEVMEAELAFWRERLTGMPGLLEMPTDRPRPELTTTASRSLPVAFSTRTSEAVRAFGRQAGSTLFMTMMAAFQSVLFRTSHQADFGVGTVAAGRGRAEVEPLIGFFVNTLVFRADFSGAPGFHTLLERTKEWALAAHAHQDVPFERLVEEVRPERNLSHPPLFQVVFTVQNTPNEGLELRGLTLRPFALEGTAALRPDLNLNLLEHRESGRLVGSAGYKLALFDATTVRRLLRTLEALLTSALAHPEEPIAALPLLRPAERHQLTSEWSAEKTPDAGGRFVHQLIEAQVERVPDAVALACDGDRLARLSFGELNARANRLAWRLRGLGVGPEGIVAMAAERSPELLVGLLAIFKSNGVYLPLDPGSPSERLGFMLDDSEARVCLTQTHLREHLPETFRGEVIALDADTALPGRDGADTDLPCAVTGRGAAYVIYTSGSTGRPKGVVIDQRSIADRIWYSIEDGFGAERFLQRSSISFDISLAEMLTPLVAGGLQVMTRPDSRNDPDDFDRLIRDEDLTFVSFPPQILDFLLEKGAVGRWTTMNHVSTGSEAVPVEFPRRFLAQSSARFYNRYGPTETTISITAWPAPAAARATRYHRLPIGRPLARAEIYVLGPRLRVVPAGVAGEVAVGGECLGRGYLGRPRRTAQSFVADGVTGASGGRLYRTGDLGRWRSDGLLDFLGRADRQVKVRGFRVELGEIETTLRRHAAIADVAVVDHKDEASQTLQLVAYVVALPGAALPDISELREHVGLTLPTYMVPAAFVELDSIPYLPSRKADKKALPAPERGLPSDADQVAPRNEVETKVAAIWRDVLGLESVGVHDNFFDLGGHSMLMVRLQSRLREELGREVAILDLFRHPTIAAFVDSAAEDGVDEPAPRAAAGERRAELRARSSRGTSSDVAVIGLAGRFPGAGDVDAFWHNLRQGVESVTFFSDEELLEAGVAAPLLEQDNYVKARARLEDTELFDAALFGMSPREAQVLDPQQRLFLECAWEVLEDAGYDPKTYDGAIGVFAGIGLSRYWTHLLSDPQLMASIGMLQATLGNDKDFLPTRVSYKLNLTGPSVNVQTACSTSLVGLHLAGQALLRGECDMALAGGVSLAGSQVNGYVYEPDGILSPDGHCRAFDARGAGTIGGSGAGVVVLKRLDEALADGDRVRAVVKGSALNNDGSFKVGFTAPSIEGQAKVIAEAQAVAGVEPATVGLVEGHGTATPLGDPIEVAALKEVFGDEPGERCALGSVKTNVGHLGAAAGAAGLIKAVLAVEHGQIPPSLHFEEPNPKIGLEASPFYVPTTLEDWPANGGPRRAGVSSFGLGGTNAHVVLEEAPAPAPSGPSRPWQLLVLSAKTESSVEAVVERLAAHLRESPETEFADAAFTLRVGRQRLEHRRILVCRDAEDAARALESRDPKRLFTAVEERTGRGVAFLLPGLGDHYDGMARDLYRSEPAFRDEMDRASEILLPILGEDLRELLNLGGEAGESGGGEAGESGGGEPEIDLRKLLGRTEDAASKPEGPLDRIEVAHPAIFAIEAALARLWSEWGVVPEAMIGYSLGEYTAAYLAGVFSLQDALALVAERARLVAELPEGAMLAVPLALEETRPLLGGELSLAVSSSPQLTVVAGPAAAVAALEEELRSRGLVSQRLKSGHAFHSTLMEPVAERLAEHLSRIELHPPRIPYLSNVTGTWIRAEQATDPQYWARHLCRTVRYAEGMSELLDAAQPGRVLLEVGPGQALSTSARQQPAFGDHLALASLRDERERQSDVAFALTTLGRLWLAGVDVDWPGFTRHERRHRVRLPTYAFDRQRFWVDAQAPAAAAAGRSPDRQKPDPADWFYVPAWRVSEPPEEAEPDESGSASWLVLTQDGLGPRLAEKLRSQGQDVVTLTMGEPFQGLGEGRSAGLDPERPEDYEALVEELRNAGRLPRHVVHLWSLSAAGEPVGFDEAQRSGLYSVLFLARALAKQGVTEDLELSVVTNGLHAVRAGDPVLPEKATLVGALKVLPQEYRNIRCRSFDVVPPAPGSPGEDELLADLVADLAPRHDGPATDLTVAYRLGVRWIRAYDPLRLRAPRGARPALRQGGVYLLTGGFGRIGRIVSRYLADRVAARLVLLGRSACPPRDQWDTWLEAHGEDDATAGRILQIRELEAAGAEVLALEADAADRRQMAAAVTAARQRFGTIHGVVHLAGLTARDALTVAVEETGPEACRRHFLPKAEALYALEEALAGLELDFRVLFSSLSTVLGGLGFAAYASANAFMDAFAEARSQAGEAWLSVAWDGWRSTEEAPGGATVSMGPSRSCEAFHRVLAMRAAPRMVVSTADLEARLDRWVRFTADREAQERQDQGAGAAFDRPNLQTPFVAASDELETSVVEIWQDLLGIGRIGIHDNFFELGGDSLLATQVVSRLRRVVQVELPLQVFLNAPTVAETAEIARREDYQQEELQTIEDLLAQVQGLSEDELEAALGEHVAQDE